ncbi:MAG: VOC family protein [Gammaproteobacteria bacterium]|nr:VOC family protein [Gammaproteobacteria bacterium]
MKSVNPYLNFPGNSEEAFNYYKTVFGGEIMMIVRFRDFGDNGMGVAEEDLDKVAHIALPLGPDHVLMATDCVGSMGKNFIAGNNYYITLEADTGDEADRLFNALSDGGNVEMPLQRTEWAEKYGVCADRFGVQWMVSHTGEVQFQPRA